MPACTLRQPFVNSSRPPLFLVCLLVSMLSSALACAQSPAPPPPAPALSFDVAAIYRHIPQPHEHNSIWSSPSDSHFKAENVSLFGLIRWAFDMPETRIFGVPGWAGSTMFNIDATSDASVDAQLHELPPDAARLQKERMVRALLADRFQLVAHRGTRLLPVYALVVAKGGAKLGPSREDGTVINHGSDHIEVEGANSVALLAEELSKEVGRVVVDQTGLPGRFKLLLAWAPDDTSTSPSSSGNPRPSIFTALQEQLGLRLEARKGPVEVLVVDHVALPSGN